MASMRAQLLPALVGALLGRLCDCIAVDGQVHVLTQDNFAAGVGKFPFTFVKFLAPWCGHCKKLVPEWEKTAQLAVAYDIPLATVDAIAEEKLAQDHAVQSFPTLFLFKGSPLISVKYNGPRDAASMADWLHKWTETEGLARPEPSEEGVKAWAPTAKVKVLGLLSGQAEADKSLQKLLEAASFMLNPAGPASEEMPVGLAEMPGGELAKLSVKGVTLPCIALLRDFEFEEQTLIYQEDSSRNEADELRSFVSWLEVRSAPTLIEASKETEKLFLKDIEPGHAVAILFGSDQNAVSQIHKLAVEMSVSSGKLKWVHAKQDDFGQNLAKSVGIEGMNFPDFVLWEFGESEDDDRVFKLSQQEGYSSSSFTSSDLGQVVGNFIENWTGGHLSAETDPVIALTSASFEQVVLDSSKDVLVEFYAPWCGHCKSLAPEYKEVAKHYAHDKSVAIAKLDSTQHSHHSAKISSYPTLFVYPKSNKEDPILLEFKANRNKANLIEAFEEHRGSSSSGRVKKAPTPVKKEEVAKKAPDKKSKFKEVACPDDADIFACSTWCEASSSPTMRLVGTLGGKTCEDWKPDDKPHDATTCTCYDEDFTDAFLTCHPNCKQAKARGGTKKAIPIDLVDDRDDPSGDTGTCAAGDTSASCRGGSTRTTTPMLYDDDDDIAADF